MITYIGNPSDSPKRGGTGMAVKEADLGLDCLLATIGLAARREPAVVPEFDVEAWSERLPLDAAPDAILDFWREATGRQDPISAVPTGSVDLALRDLYGDAVRRYLAVEIGRHQFPVPDRDGRHD